MKLYYIGLTIIVLLFFSLLYSCEESAGISDVIPPNFSGEYYPGDHESISTLQPMLYVRNFEDFNGRSLIYDFELFTDDFGVLLDRGTDIIEGNGGYEDYTGWQTGVTLEYGQTYTWRVHAKSEHMVGPWEVDADFWVRSLFPPSPYFPTDGETVDSATPWLCILNSAGVPGARTYDFEVYGDEELTQLITGQQGIAESSDMTCWRTNMNLASNTMYYWRARGNLGGEYSEWSDSASFYMCVCESTAGTEWAQAVVESNVDDCDGINVHTNAWEALGPPNATGTTDDTYQGFVSLGLGGSIILDMGVCIFDGHGYDLWVYQYISNEAVEVQVSSCRDGTYYSLGTEGCQHPRCGFDISDIPLENVRFVKLIDRSEVVPCYAHIGADIDAVQAVYFH